MKHIPKGVHDPWRIGTPEWELPKQPATNQAGMRKSTHPFDWDLQPDKRCLLHLDGASGALIVSGTDDMAEAAEVVVQVIQEFPDLALELEKEGFTHGPITDIRVQNFFLKTKQYLVTHPIANNQTFTRLIRAFLRVNRTKHGNQHLKKRGIKPLLEG